MHSRTPGFSLALPLLIAGFLFAVPGSAPAQGDLPDQMVYFGLDGDPISDPRSAPVRFVAAWMEFPDARQGQLYRLSWWKKIGNSHAAQVSLDYAGVESASSYRYGGGRPRVRWTSRIGAHEGFGLAIDLAGHVPLGDETLFPLSARAPMAIVRLRASLFHVGGVRLWGGWWGRQVSPPSASNRQDPLTSFASGSGFDALMEWRFGTVDVDWLLHLPTGGNCIAPFTGVWISTGGSPTTWPCAWATPWTPGRPRPGPTMI